MVVPEEVLFLQGQEQSEHGNGCPHVTPNYGGNMADVTREKGERKERKNYPDLKRKTATSLIRRFYGIL